MKHIFSAFIALLTILPSSVVALVAPSPMVFNDVPTSMPYATAIDSLKGANIIEGYSDGSFKPNDTINRAEFTKIIVGATLQTELANTSTSLLTNCFTDVQDQWFAQYVCSAKAAGVLNGYADGSFKPAQNINFAEASKIITNAYKVDSVEYATWYKGYVKALESAKAIPLSIANMDQAITRGQMAEMIWRVRNEISTEPTKSYLNIENPTLGINLAANTIVYPTSCTDLETVITDTQEQQVNMYYMEGMDDMVAMPTMNVQGSTNAPQAESTAKIQAESNDYAQTNVQVVGVDEADIVKTDGNYIYSLQNGNFTITKIGNNGSMALVHEEQFAQHYANTTKAGVNFWPNELYVQNGTIVLIGTSTNSIPQVIDTIEDTPPNTNGKMRMIAPYPYYQINKSEVRLFNFTNETLTLQRTVALEGDTLSTRLINDTLYLVANKNLYWNYGPYPTPLTKKVLPQFLDSATGNTEADIVNCSKVAILPHMRDPQYLIVASIPVANTALPVNREVIIGNGQNVYMSTQNLYIAQTDYNYSWIKRGEHNEQTHIHRFAIDGSAIAYKDSGTVPGQILTQFSMDEYNSTFRIATTINKWGNSGTNTSTNNLYVLNSAMDLVGSITDIAPGERIFSTRFMGDRTYMVTFKNIDPFFVLDTSDPRNPTILGQLKIPGYSDYLHPYDATHILGFGKEAVSSKDANFAWYQGMKVAMFDVSDVTNPTLLHTVTIGDRGTDSPLLQNHKALLFEKDRNLLAFPITINTLTDEQKKNNADGNAYGETTFQGALVYTVTVKDGFTERGRITHYTKEDVIKLGSYYYGKSIERILRIGSYLYTLGQDGLQSYSEDTVTLKNSVQFTQPKQEVYPIMY